MVFQQVDLVDVEKSTVRLREQTRREMATAFGECALDVQRADDAVFGCTEGQVHYRHRQAAHWRLALRMTRPAVMAPVARRLRIAVIDAICDDLHRRQQRRERTDRGRLAGATVAEQQHPADVAIHRRRLQRQFHLFLTDDGGERKQRGLRHQTSQVALRST